MYQDNDLVLVSGGFDPIHGGHIDLIRGASEYGRVVIALNSDDWLINKKGACFMEWDERAKVLSSMRWVEYVVGFDDSDGTACRALKEVRPRYFANGGDRMAENTPELSLCLDMSIMPLFGIGGETKANSSSELLHKWSVNPDVMV